MKKSEALHILELKDGASDDEVRKAHRRLVIANHPDKFGQDADKRAQAEEKTKLINEARDVLLSRKWDPEFRTAGTPYGAPFNYNPYAGAGSGGQGAGGSGSGASGQNPFGAAGFGAWPFGGAQTVWFTQDRDGNVHVYTSADAGSSGSSQPGRNAGSNPFGGTGANPFGGAGTNPFGGSGSSPFGGGASNPFSSMGFNPFGSQRSEPAELRCERAKNELTFDATMLLLKMAAFACCALFWTPAMGAYLYVVLSIAQGVFKRLKFFGAFLVLPLVLITVILAPIMTGGIGVIGGIALLFALWFDFSNITTNFSTWRELKKRVGSSKRGKKASKKD